MEYTAESFVSWLKGELRIDPRLQEWFDSRAQVLPADPGNWRQIQTEKGEVHVSSLHGKKEEAANIKIATYLANKHDMKISLIPDVKETRNADSFNETREKYEEYKAPTSYSYSAIDNAIREGSKQANNLVIEVKDNFPLGDISRALNNRVKFCPDIETIRIIRNGKDALFERKGIVRNGFKIEEADFE